MGGRPEEVPRLNSVDPKLGGTELEKFRDNQYDANLGTLVSAAEDDRRATPMISQR